MTATSAVGKAGICSIHDGIGIFLHHLDFDSPEGYASECFHGFLLYGIGNGKVLGVLNLFFNGEMDALLLIRIGVPIYSMGKK